MLPRLAYGNAGGCLSNAGTFIRGPAGSPGNCTTVKCFMCWTSLGRSYLRFFRGGSLRKARCGEQESGPEMWHGSVPLHRCSRRTGARQAAHGTVWRERAINREISPPRSLQTHAKRQIAKGVCRAAATSWHQRPLLRQGLVHERERRRWQQDKCHRD